MGGGGGSSSSIVVEAWLKATIPSTTHTLWTLSTDRFCIQRLWESDHMGFTETRADWTLVNNTLEGEYTLGSLMNNRSGF